MPAEGPDRFLCGTQPVLSMLGLDEALNVWADVDMTAVREKSTRLTSLFIDQVETRCKGHGLELISPQEATCRGGHVSFAREDDGHAIMQAMIDRGVIGDFRPPNILRFGIAPLYVGYADVWKAADVLADILETRAWDNPRFRQALTVP